MGTVKAGIDYFAVVFATGFVLGTIRTMLLTPHVGELPAVGIELPIMLTESWLACGWALRRFTVSERFLPRLVMGDLAFGLLIGAETALGVLAFGRSLGEQMASYHELGAQLGLAAQVAFAAFPLIRRTS